MLAELSLMVRELTGFYEVSEVTVIEEPCGLFIGWEQQIKFEAGCQPRVNKSRYRHQTIRKRNITK